MGCIIICTEEEINNKKHEGDYILSEGLSKICKLSNFYKISKNIIGEGASGQVCIGEKDNKKYAIKRIRKDGINSSQQMILEAEISLNISHKNIMNYIEIFEDLNYINCVMELSEGGDLFDFILDYPSGHLPNDIAIDLLI